MTDFARELVTGLSSRPRAIAPKWFYDRTGSNLFEQICGLPEYYPTRTEFALLEQHGREIARRIGPGAAIVEFGAGSVRKVRLLLDLLDAPTQYVPVDVSGDHLADAVAALRMAHPSLPVEPVVADFADRFDLPPVSGPRVGFFPGSSIGNFDPTEAKQLLQHFAGLLSGGGLLIGVDLVKDPRTLHAAYNDPSGVTAAFNLNLWTRANREAGADFDLARWAHWAFYNPALQRIEMHLVCRCTQRVSVAGQTFDFAEGESVHTENSYKYTVDGFRRLAIDSGWLPREVWIDADRLFSLHWLQCGTERGSTD